MIFGFHCCLTAGSQISRICLRVKPNKHENITGNKELWAKKLICCRTKVQGSTRQEEHHYNLHCNLKDIPTRQSKMEIFWVKKGQTFRWGSDVQRNKKQISELILISCPDSLFSVITAAPFLCIHLWCSRFSDRHLKYLVKVTVSRKSN